MRTICLAFKSDGCDYDICQKMCHDTYPDKQNECVASCVINIAKASDNPQAKSILEYFL